MKQFKEMEMNEKERYLFDLNGYLVIPNALSKRQVTSLNKILDTYIESECSEQMNTYRFDRGPSYKSLLNWGKEYSELIDNPTVMPYLTEVLGNEFRLDHLYLDIIKSGKGPIGTRLHGGPFPVKAHEFFRFADGKMYNGLSVIAYNLKNMSPKDGGFGCVPGSHKSNYHFPEDWKEMDTLTPIVEPVTGPAGTAVIFTEALTHGTLPWTGLDERRTLFFKYSPSSIAWAKDYLNPNDYQNLSDSQKNILEGPNARYQYKSSGGKVEFHKKRK